MSVVWLSLSVAGAIMLFVSGVLHSRNWRALLASLLAHRILPYRVARPLARTLPVTMILLAGAFAVVLVVPSAPPVLRLVSAGAPGVLLATMSIYLVALLWLRSAAECNCFGGKEPVTVFSPLRTLLAAAGFVGFAAGGGVSWDHLVVAVPTGAVLTGVAILAPAFHRFARPAPVLAGATSEGRR